MVDGPRGRQPFTPGNERPTRTRNNSGGNKGSTGGRRDGQGGNGPTQGPRDGNFYDRTNSGAGGPREGGFQDRGPGGYRDRGAGAGSTGGAREGGFYDRGQRTNRREGSRPANPQVIQHRAVHYQVVTMDDEEWGDTLEHRLNSLGHDGWRLVAIDEGRQYVFMQTE